MVAAYVDLSPTLPRKTSALRHPAVVFINRFQTFISQQIVFEELFASSLFGLAALIPALSTPTNVWMVDP